MLPMVAVPAPHSSCMCGMGALGKREGLRTLLTGMDVHGVKLGAAPGPLLTARAMGRERRRGRARAAILLEAYAARKQVRLLP